MSLLLVLFNSSLYKTKSSHYYQFYGSDLSFSYSSLTHLEGNENVAAYFVQTLYYEHLVSKLVSWRAHSII